MSLLPDTCEAANFRAVYEELLWRILRHGLLERNERTGKEIKAYPNGGISFRLDLADGFLPVAGNRKLFPATAAAETAWYIMGTQDPAFMLKHARVVWEKFVEQEVDVDPMHPPREIVKAAYGYRWRRHFKRDQLFLAIEALRRNPSDRRIWISAWDPSEDGLGARGQLNVPCPVGFTFSIQGGRLQSSYFLRSSDVFVGLPYDVMGHAMLMAAVAAELGIPLGVMHFTLAHPHVYDVHWDMAQESMRAAALKSTVKLYLPATVSIVEQFPDAFVEQYQRQGKEAIWPEYHCRPEVVQ